MHDRDSSPFLVVPEDVEDLIDVVYRLRERTIVDWELMIFDPLRGVRGIDICEGDVLIELGREIGRKFACFRQVNEGAYTCR